MEQSPISHRFKLAENLNDLKPGIRERKNTLGDRLAGLSSDKLVTVHIAIALGSSNENPGTDTAGMGPNREPNTYETTHFMSHVGFLGIR